MFFIHGAIDCTFYTQHFRFLFLQNIYICLVLSVKIFEDFKQRDTIKQREQI